MKLGELSERKTSMKTKAKIIVIAIAFVVVSSFLLKDQNPLSGSSPDPTDRIKDITATTVQSNITYRDITKTPTVDETDMQSTCAPDSEVLLQQAITAEPLPAPNTMQSGETGHVEDRPKSEWEDRLYQASLKFIANTPEQADEIAKSIGYLGGVSESASNVCGPLSIAILKEAGFFPSSTNVKPSWLLCAREREDCSGINTLKRVFFPPSTNEYYLINENIRNYDFASNPLQAGDFLYLFSGATGYDHMLVITRVDDEGAAYSVTNADRGEGFTIKEELLYHPAKFQEGFFYEFTERSRGMLGMTGNGGMLIIRRKDGLESLPALTGELDHTLAPNVRWSILVKEMGEAQVLFENYPNLPFHPASMIKIPIAMVSMQILENQGIFPDEFSQKGYGGRTFEQLFYGMVVNNEEDGMEILVGFIRANGGENKIFNNWQINDTLFLPRRTTAYDLATFLEGLYSNEFIHPDMRDYLLSLMAVYTENDTQYLGKITSSIDGGVLYNKRGTLLSPTIVSDMGVLIVSDQAYIIVISGTPEKCCTVTFEEIKASLEDFAEALGEIIASSNLDG